MAAQLHRGLDWLVGQLDAFDQALDEPTAHRLLAEANLGLEEVAPFVEPSAETYSRRCVARRETYELLVLTWAPSQGSVAHDHSGSLCGLKVVQGRLTEQLFAQGADGQVRKTTSQQISEGGILVDPGGVVHALGNAPGASENLITVHIYSPPLPEIRRYAVTDQPPTPFFQRTPAAGTPVVAILGGGFSGTMTLANLLRFGGEGTTPLHVVMIDRQPALGEGIAYRTNDSRHLLNVPAGRMSAWPDRADDFLQFAQARDAATNAGDFLPRKIYGQYVRQTLLDLAAQAPAHLSGEMIHDEATTLTPREPSRWTIHTAGGRTIDADQVVITMGHRPPDDPLTQRWTGPRYRFVGDPWAALILSQIGPDEPVLLLGSGLTAIDTLLTLCRRERRAPITIVSRRGLLPLPHARDPKPAADVADLIAALLDPAQPLTARRLALQVRRKVRAGEQAGLDWRQVVDGLRPAIAKLWGRLSTRERRRFLQRIRPFWEIHRHRMAPEIAETLATLQGKGEIELVSGTLLSAAADAEGVDVVLCTTGGVAKRKVRASWVINCTGPGAHNRHCTHPILRPLLESGLLREDDLHLGLQTNAEGQALDASDRPVETLWVVGTLRKPALWESTAVPELRQQAQAVAQATLRRVVTATGSR
jgi:uncharacterized NAD(P)/FAD-binding protein YdhS/predicted metal-dependent enzyme (double-stranded beta helix superfamily)